MQPLVCFGGTFNPVHVGHLIVARSVAEQLGANRVVLIPAAIPPHKARPGAAAEDRLEMLRLAVAGEELFEVDSLELERPGPSYTIDTLGALRRRHGSDAELVWVIGLDMLAELPGWHRAAEVIAEARIITAARPPMPQDLEERLAGLGRAFGEEQARRLRAGMLATPLIDVSATEIRQRVRHGRSVRYLVPDAVADYIQRHGLYRE